VIVDIERLRVERFGNMIRMGKKCWLRIFFKVNQKLEDKYKDLDNHSLKAESEEIK
jgi:hypothetical protein